jgi:hypothetical protein
LLGPASCMYMRYTVDFQVRQVNTRVVDMA